MLDYQRMLANKLDKLTKTVEKLNVRVKQLESERNNSSTLSVSPLPKKRGRPPKRPEL